MNLLFARKTFLATEDEFQKLSYLTSPRQYGDFQIFTDGLKFTSESGASLEIPMGEIRKIKVVSERTLWWYWMVLLSAPILLTYFLPGNWTMENLILFLLGLVLVSIFMFGPLFGRRWVQVTSENEGFSGYFSFDWRQTYFRFPWTRQVDIFMWLINKGDCYEVWRIINKLKRSASSARG